MASVWDGTRSKFVPAGGSPLGATASKVWFIRLQANLPDDLLVATRKAHAVAEAIRGKLAAQDGKSSYPTGSDVQGWVLWSDNDAEDARTALSELRRQAAASTQPVVVDVHPTSADPASADEVEAVRQAVRLAGTELVAKCESSDYKKIDIVWELARTHDGAVRMTVRYDHFRYTPTGRGRHPAVRDQLHGPARPDAPRERADHVPHASHPARVALLGHGSHRDPGRGLRLDDTPLPFQEILWKNPRRNDYTVLGRTRSRSSRIPTSTSSSWPRPPSPTLAFEPMGRRAFRVLLVRPNRERPLFQALTVAFVALLGLAAIGLVWDARRRLGPVFRRRRAPGAQGRSSASLMPDARTPALPGRA